MVSPAGLSRPPGARWSEVPDEITLRILDFDPDAAPALLVVSRELGRIGAEFLKTNKERIIVQCSTRSSLLACFVHDYFSCFNICFGPQYDPHDVQFHLSLPRFIRAAGVPMEECPDRILVPEQVVAWGSVTQVEQNRHLQKMWGPIRDAVEQEFPEGEISEEEEETIPEERIPEPEEEGTPVPDFPELNASAQQIRGWMGTFLPWLEEMTMLNLCGQDLRIVPMEICLFRGLTHLDLSENWLQSLPGFLSHMLCGLTELDVSGNEISSVSSEFFSGMSGLTRLDLSRNRLSVLPPDFLNGLERLESISLEGNPGLMVSYEDVAFDMNYFDFRAMMADFFKYECRSEFSLFYRFVAAGCSRMAANEAFSQLSERVQNALFSQVCVVTGHPPAHAFEDMRRFRGALKGFVIDQFEGLTSGQREVMYGQVSHLARREGEVHGEAPHDLEWGRLHAKENLLRLIDALLGGRQGTKRGPEWLG